jgi:hypothetical protein
MRAFHGSWRVLAGAGLLATIAVTGCTAGSTSSPGAPGDGQPTSQPATTAVGTSPAGQSSAPTPSVSPTEAAGIENLLVTSAVRSQLTAAYVALRQISVSDVSGTQPNSVYYAYDRPLAGAAGRHTGSVRRESVLPRVGASGLGNLDEPPPWPQLLTVGPRPAHPRYLESDGKPIGRERRA